MQLVPFQNVRQRPPRKLAGNHTRLDLNRDLKLAVEGVKVRRLMVPVENGDHNPQEPRDLRRLAIIVQDKPHINKGRCKCFVAI